MFLLLAAVLSCGLAPKQIAKTVIDVGLAACIAEHAEVEDEAALKELCKWTDELAPLVKDLLSARKRGLQAAAKRGACGPDGGK